MKASGQLHVPAVYSGTHCVGSWVGLNSGLDAVKKRKIYFPAGIRTPAVQPEA
jgi:hypothetical protein